MPTKSFTDAYIIKSKDVKRFYDIMNDSRKIKITKVKDHKTIRDKEEIKKLLKL